MRSQFERACNKPETNNSSKIVSITEREMKEMLLEDEASLERKPFAFPRNIFDGENCHIMQSKFHASKNHTKLWIFKRRKGIKTKEEMTTFPKIFV